MCIRDRLWHERKGGNSKIQGITVWMFTSVLSELDQKSLCLTCSILERWKHCWDEKDCFWQLPRFSQHIAVLSFSCVWRGVFQQIAWMIPKIELHYRAYYWTLHSMLIPWLHTVAETKTLASGLVLDSCSCYHNSPTNFTSTGTKVASLVCDIYRRETYWMTLINVTQ